MEGKCKGCGFILGILIIVFALLIDMFPTSKWILVVLGVIILLHPILCKKCSPCREAEAEVMPKKKKR